MRNPAGSGLQERATDSELIEQPVAPYIDGALCDSNDRATVDVINPSNGRRCLIIPAGCEADVDHAVSSARRAFNDGRWRDMPPSAKKQVLHRLATLIAEHAAELDRLDAGEMGKPVSVRFGNSHAAADLVRFYAEAVDKLAGDVYTSDKHSFVAQRRVPRGVVAAVLPWNFPTLVAVLKLAPALAAGNCVVMKPSELSSRSALKLAQLALQAGLPAGVLNIVPGRGETVGRALGLHPDVDMIAFTGSTSVGKRMMQYSAQSNMKLVAAECGGKSPQIVFDDGVDLDAASDAIARFLLTNQGQICSVGSRLLVQRSIEAELVDRVVARISGGIVIGDALDPATTFGPLSSAAQCERVMGYIQSAAADGAQLVAGGRRVLKESGGYFVEPTAYCEVSPSARIAQEEIFGPVLSIIPFEDEAEALTIANGTLYGLMAYVWTTDLSRGMRMVKGMQSSVIVNAAAPSGEGAGHATCVEPAKQSGIGVEGGLGGMETYLRRQLLCFNHA